MTTSRLLGSLLVAAALLTGCSSDPGPDEEGGSALTAEATSECDATLGGKTLDLVCKHQAAGASATACVYAPDTKPYVTLMGYGADRDVSGIANFEDASRHDLLRIGPGFGRPITIIGGARTLNRERTAFNFEDSTFSVKAIKDLERLWDSADVLAGLEIDFWYATVAEATSGAPRSPQRIAELKAKRDEVLAKCIAEGAPEKTCKESTILTALWTAHKLPSEAELRKVADVDKRVTLAIPFTCTKP
ncbi:MAG: hypothetical protein U0235_08925 [Polyangiaceae bacterium]